MAPNELVVDDFLHVRSYAARSKIPTGARRTPQSREWQIFNQKPKAPSMHKPTALHKYIMEQTAGYHGVPVPEEFAAPTGRDEPLRNSTPPGIGWDAEYEALFEHPGPYGSGDAGSQAAPKVRLADTDGPAVTTNVRIFARNARPQSAPVYRSGKSSLPAVSPSTTKKRMTRPASAASSRQPAQQSMSAPAAAWGDDSGVYEDDGGAFDLTGLEEAAFGGDEASFEDMRSLSDYRPASAMSESRSLVFTGKRPYVGARTQSPGPDSWTKRENRRPPSRPYVAYYEGGQNKHIHKNGRGTNGYRYTNPGGRMNYDMAYRTSNIPIAVHTTREFGLSGSLPISTRRDMTSLNK